MARALAADPPVLLMDEPFGAVDPIVRKRLQSEFHELQARLTKTVVFVTHDVDEAILLGDRMVVLNVGGIVEQYDTPEKVLAEPASDFVERFLGGERGLKRLALLPISKRTEPGPFVDVSMTADQARRVMEEHGVDWLGFSMAAASWDGSTAPSWIELTAGSGAEAVPRDAEERLVSATRPRRCGDQPCAVAVVVDDGIYRGMLDLEAIAEGDHGMSLVGQTTLLIDWDWIARNVGEIADRTWQHLSLTASRRHRLGHVHRDGDRRAPLALGLLTHHLGQRPALHDPVTGPRCPVGARRGAQCHHNAVIALTLHVAHHHQEPGSRHRRRPRCRLGGCRWDAGIHAAGQVLEDGGSPCLSSDHRRAPYRR